MKNKKSNSSLGKSKLDFSLLGERDAKKEVITALNKLGLRKQSLLLFDVIKKWDLYREKDLHELISKLNRR